MTSDIQLTVRDLKGGAGAQQNPGRHGCDLVRCDLFFGGGGVEMLKQKERPAGCGRSNQKWNFS